MAFSVVVPVRTGPGAKSRLGAPSAVARAIAGDTLAAVAACDLVAAVTVVRDETSAPLDVPASATVVAQPSSTPGLSAAIGHGLARVGGAVAVLLGDLPALRPSELAHALSRTRALLASGATAAYVPDAENEGSVLLAARCTNDLPLHFGPGSAEAHRCAGARAIDAGPRLRRDVDTPAQLWQAWDLGVGPRTRARLVPVQVTVLGYDASSARTEVVTDDGVRLAAGPAALNGSGLRLLRPGQRLSALVHVDADGRSSITALRLLGVGEPLPG